MAVTKRNGDNIIRFALAGTSCVCAAFVTNPIDVVKVRMQLENELSKKKDGTLKFTDRYYKGFIRGIARIIVDEGVRGVYKGVTASLMREGSYSTIRLGAYEPLKEIFGATDPAHTPLWKKICSGAISGAIGSSVATPTDLVKVRMQAEGRLAPGQAPRYRNTFSAFAIIIKENGIRGLYVGVGPTVQRAAILTASQIPAYDHTKHAILNMGWLEEGPGLHVVSSMIAGFVAAFTTSPVDVIKTRIMNQKTDPNSKPYKNAVDCCLKTLRTEGISGLYKGFIANWMRIGPHTVTSFFIFEQLRKLTGIRPL